MEDVFRAIVLGIVQGLTEFLPISSSGHLILTREITGWDFQDNLTFDVAIHMGTLVAVLAYFWNEWVLMARGALSWLAGDREKRVGQPYDGHLLGIIVVGSIPVGIIGLALDSLAEEKLRNVGLFAVMLIIGGIVLWIADRIGRQERHIEDATLKDSLLIGSAQALALVPGVSRSGATLSAALFDRFERRDAARFSFLLSTPAIAGAGLYKGLEAIRNGLPSSEIPPIIAGTIAAGIVGWFAIRFLLRLVQTQTFLPFVVYRLVVGTVILAVLLIVR